MSSFTPYPVGMALASEHMCMIFENDMMKCWGNGIDGELGLGISTVIGDEAGEMGSSLPPVELGTDRYAVQVEVGAHHTCAILDGDGAVKCWGRNNRGVLGLGTTTWTIGVASGEMGDDLDMLDLGPDKAAKQLVSGNAHMCALFHDDTVKCWGMNVYGHLGLEDDMDRGDDPSHMGVNLPTLNFGDGKRPVQLAAGIGHTCAVFDDNTIKCWGENYTGQLGYENYNMYGMAIGDMGENLPTVDLGVPGLGIQQLVAGDEHNCVLFVDHSVKCWGVNGSGELGIEDIIEKGGYAGSMGIDLPFVSLGSDAIPIQLAADGHHTCALFENGGVKCWGASTYYNAGAAASTMGDNLPYVGFDVGKTPVQIGAGKDFNCAIFSDQTVGCWGPDNSFGQFGIGTTDGKYSDTDPWIFVDTGVEMWAKLPMDPTPEPTSPPSTPPPTTPPPNTSPPSTSPPSTPPPTSFSTSPTDIAPAKVLRLEGGKVYVGPVNEENRMNGFGVLHYPGGNEFRGFFVNGSREGRGTMLMERGRVKNMAGDMHHDKWNGWVAVRYRNGDKFTGKFVNGTSHGPGTFHYRNGTVVGGRYQGGVLLPPQAPAMPEE